MNQQITRTVRTIQEGFECSPATDSDPFGHCVAYAFLQLLHEKDIVSPTILPEDFAWRLCAMRNPISGDLWRNLATRDRSEQGDLVFRLCELSWMVFVSDLTHFAPGNEFIIAPIEMGGIDWLRRLVEGMDYLYLPKLGLDKCRSIDMRGRVTYPEVEEARNRARQRTVSRYGLYNFDRLVDWVTRLGELYGFYPEPVFDCLQNRRVAEIIARQIADLNSDIL